jgi:glycosyltransferase involved in cell wall biosynthesis
VGNLIERKGHAVLLHALAAIGGRGTHVPWRLAIAGEGVERPRLEALTREYGLTDRVRLLGARNDIPDLQAGADVFVMPSLWEGLPLAVLEAMVAGKPIVASRTSGIPEAIEDGRQGVLVPPGDVQALADALWRLMNEPELRASLGRAALERARSRFTIAAMVDQYERLYRQYLAQSQPWRVRTQGSRLLL